MHLDDIYPGPLWHFPVYTICVLAIVSGILGLSYVLGQRHRQRATAEPYESGIVPTGTARVRFHIRFYLVGVLFVVFDIEAVFIIVWAVAVRELGWPGYFAMVLFVGVLGASLFYLVRCEALRWREMRRAREETGRAPPAAMRR